MNRHPNPTTAPPSAVPPLAPSDWTPASPPIVLPGSFQPRSTARTPEPDLGPPDDATSAGSLALRIISAAFSFAAAGLMVLGALFAWPYYREVLRGYHVADDYWWLVRQVPFEAVALVVIPIVGGVRRLLGRATNHAMAALIALVAVLVWAEITRLSGLLWWYSVWFLILVAGALLVAMFTGVPLNRRRRPMRLTFSSTSLTVLLTLGLSLVVLWTALFYATGWVLQALTFWGLQFLMMLTTLAAVILTGFWVRPAGRIFLLVSMALVCVVPAVLLFAGMPGVDYLNFNVVEVMGLLVMIVIAVIGCVLCFTQPVKDWYAGAWQPAPKASVHAVHTAYPGAQGISAQALSGGSPHQPSLSTGYAQQVIRGNPRAVHPHLPSTTGVFWLSFFVGVFGYLLAHAHGSTAQRMGYLTSSYTYAWLKGWAVGFGVAMLATIIFYAAVWASLGY